MKCPNCPQNTSTSINVSGKFKVYYCVKCQNGFTVPVPKNIYQYYPAYYWKNINTVTQIKNRLFSILQRRRVVSVINNINEGKILDVGAGQGKYFSKLPKKYRLISQEPKKSKVKNRNLTKKDFLTWPVQDQFDMVCFWESLEHTPKPHRYLKKAHTLLKTDGKIIIESPLYESWESKLFGKYWFHLDLPRHLSHLTIEGVQVLLKRAGFRKIKHAKVLSLDYAPWGLMASVFNIFKIDITDYFKKSGSLISLGLILPLFCLSSIIEVFLWSINQSPIMVVEAKK